MKTQKRVRVDRIRAVNQDGIEVVAGEQVYRLPAKAQVREGEEITVEVEEVTEATVVEVKKSPPLKRTDGDKR